MATTSEQLSVKERLKQRSERNTVFVIVVLGLLYGFFYLPEPVLKVFQDRFHQVGGILAELGLSAMLAGAMGFIITAQDILATCDLKASQFFRDQYPSKVIKDHYNCTQEEADFLWFSLFNPWKNADHPRNMSYLFTFQRSYDCRFIFHVRFAFAFFTVLAALTWGLTSLLNFEPPSSDLENLNYARGLLLFLVFVITMLLFGFNRLKRPSGCWKRWKEINGINIEWVKAAVFSKAKEYQSAVSLLADMSWKTQYGYK